MTRRWWKMAKRACWWLVDGCWGWIGDLCRVLDKLIVGTLFAVAAVVGLGLVVALLCLLLLVLEAMLTPLPKWA